MIVFHVEAETLSELDKKIKAQWNLTPDPDVNTNANPAEGKDELKPESMKDKAARKRAAKNAEPPAATPAVDGSAASTEKPAAASPQSAPTGSAPQTEPANTAAAVGPRESPPSTASQAGETKDATGSAPAEVISHEKLKDAMKAYLQRKGNDTAAVSAAVELMHKYGATTLSEIAPAQRAALLKELEA